MPTRWRLPNSRVSLDEQPSKTETLQTPRWDDFCFVDEAVPPISDAQYEERPKTSSGVSGRDRSKSKTRQQIGLTIIRPKTSEGRPPSTNYADYSPSKLERGMIGVAFGSPTHPPPTKSRSSSRQSQCTRSKVEQVHGRSLDPSSKAAKLPQIRMIRSRCRSISYALKTIQTSPRS